MCFSDTVKNRKSDQMGQKLPSLWVVQSVFHISSPLIFSLTKNLFSWTSWMKPNRFICHLHYESYKYNHTGLDVRIAFCWLRNSVSWLKGNVKTHCPGTVQGWFISLLSSLCLRLVPKTDIWLLAITIPVAFLLALPGAMWRQGLPCIPMHDRLSPDFALLCKMEIQKGVIYCIRLGPYVFV